METVIIIITHVKEMKICPPTFQPFKNSLLPKAVNNNSPVTGTFQEIGSLVIGSLFVSSIPSNIFSGLGENVSSPGVSGSKSVSTQTISRATQRMSEILGLIFTALFLICNYIVIIFAYLFTVCIPH